MNEKRVIVAMSGGVDSSVAAALLHDQGFEVIGITMKTWGFMEVGGAPKHESGCCSLDAIYDAKNVANSFGVPHYTVDFTSAFESEVIDNFVDEYLHGRTPNPCVLCNRKIKWEELLKKADALDAKYVATGHYANVEYNSDIDRYMLRNSANNPKDQSYALWGLTQVSLSRTLFPLGKYDKREVRSIAEKFGLKTAGKPDSQEICFVADNNYERFLNERVPNLMKNIEKGDLIYKGKKIGEHRGIPFYTIGQRRGLNVALGKPVYVKKIDYENNVIEIGDKEDILEYDLEAEDVNFVSTGELNSGEIVNAKIRYSDKGSTATVIECTGSSFKIKFLEPKNAITPGQSVVLYDDNGYVLVGGVISKPQ
ncbi:MAG: tRNA 2-thiouridine(34) synthase MnmA [Melioribacteraceae bacterium]|nr:tRNA 2-thiouridine(34) synthase MnmA [Melioribacteraceae bacterium]MCF8352930.1 tRNA 2-thiouridine(34) synthase MnmA [Melioribacteraceae bacterium]MCF8395271.1 tRNA 2-thiouridine(34) synthase MnmA [Melioribacteraceae bacterium]MCF8417447.1 tRNA 2-thiouridine(34) synthase MnmA [Melioribacteraceae bacterium]